MTIQTSLRMYDGMTPALRHMSNAMGAVIKSFEAMQQASSRSVDATAIQAARMELTQANSALNEIEESVRRADRRQEDFNDSLRGGTSAADGLASKIKGIAAAYLSIEGAKRAAGFVKDTLDFADVQNEAETKMRTIMAQRMDGGQVEFQSVMDLTAMQQSIGVVGDEMQLMGAQQLSTFLNSTGALNTLIPAMNNLAVQQNGVNLTTENMVSIGNLMGKVMQGQTAALTRVGITFSDAQEEALKYGDELQRATVLAQVITDNVGQMNEAIRNTPAGQLAAINNSFGDIKEVIGNELYPSVLHLFQVINAHMPVIQAAMSGFASGLSTLIDVLADVIDGAVMAAQVFMDNWSWIAPVIFGIAAALGIYLGVLTIYNLQQAISNGLTALAAFQSKVHAAALTLQSGATFGATVAQHGFNAALLACPITWIVIGIIAIIAILYAAVAAFNHFADGSVSATGIVCGAFAVAIAVIGNILIALWNVVVDVFVLIYNLVAEVANFIGNVFNDPVGAVCRLFFGLADTVLGVLQALAGAIDTIFGSNFAGAVQGWRNSLSGWVDDTFGRGTEIMAKMDANDLKLDRLSYGAAWDTGYALGQGIENKVKGLFSPQDLTGQLAYNPAESAWNSLESGVEDTAGNTGRMADAMEISSEDLKYMKDIAERDAINQFTTAEIKIDMGGVHNQVSSNMDLDGVVRYLEDAVYESMSVAAEGVHF